MNTGTPAQIREQVQILFERVGYDGGYILSCADHFFETPVSNLQAYSDAARECVY
jgi:uroporphyrinogen decarboxylase